MKMDLLQERVQVHGPLLTTHITTLANVRRIYPIMVVFSVITRHKYVELLSIEHYQLVCLLEWALRYFVMMMILLLNIVIGQIILITKLNTQQLYSKRNLTLLMVGLSHLSLVINIRFTLVILDLIMSNSTSMLLRDGRIQTNLFTLFIIGQMSDKP